MQQINDTTGTMRSVLRRMVPAGLTTNGNTQARVSALPTQRHVDNVDILGWE